MEIIFVLPLPLAIFMFIFCALAPALLSAYAAFVVVETINLYLPYIGFFAMVLLTIHIYIQHFKQIGLIHTKDAA